MAPSARPRVVLVRGCGIKPPPPSATLPSSGVGPPPPSGSHPLSPAAPLLAGAVPLPLLPSRRLLALSAPSPAGRRISPTLAAVYLRSSTGSLLLYSMLSASLPSLPWRRRTPISVRFLPPTAKFPRPRGRQLFRHTWRSAGGFGLRRDAGCRSSHHGGGGVLRLSHHWRGSSFVLVVGVRSARSLWASSARLRSSSLTRRKNSASSSSPSRSASSM